ncbi:S41 family peptidase [Salegentibacter chungangensis]|uniref:S41 family peptidase n=1 Tax=Salegentibacter chungangensis TaxID=1335724 RepID=A0ABW3NSG3_9FLAO
MYKLLILLILAAGLATSCSKDMDDVREPVGENPDNKNPEEAKFVVENFIYEAMDIYYLYESEVPELAEEGYFDSQADLNQFLGGFNSPEDLYYNGLVADEYDEFSFMTDDYVWLENYFQGTTGTTGMEYGWYYYPNDNSKVLGIVRYVIPGSPADEEGVERGMIFTKVDGVQITSGNLGTILGEQSFSLSLATLDENDNINETGETVDLFKEELTENPIHISKTFDLGGGKVGYLMYNGFTGPFDDELNDVFGEFKANGVTDLILDLRYNGGGDVRTATDLASMITGQYDGKLFAKEQWNRYLQPYLEENYPQYIYNNFHTNLRKDSSYGLNGEVINSLELENIYIIATRSSASASELIINGLDPYINVVHIGEKTRGKFQASVTLYDSEDFNRKDANPNHKYAIQPLVLKSVNAEGKSDYFGGLAPEISISESIRNFGELGDPSERLLSKALDAVQGIRKVEPMEDELHLKLLGESGMNEPSYQRMYIDKLPPVKRNQ